MRILYVVQYMAPVMGGPPASIATLAEGLIERGHRVEVCTTDYKLDKKQIKNLRAKGIKLRIFKSRFGHLHFCPDCKKYFSKNIKKFDIIHLNNHWSYLNIVAHNYAKKYFVPYVFSARGSFPIKQLGSRKVLLKHVYRFLWEKDIIKNASRLIALLDLEVMQYLTGNPYNTPIVKISDPVSPKVVNKARITVVGNRIRIATSHSSKNSLFTKRYGIGAKEKVILYVGRLNKRKGVDLLIRSFALICEKVKNVKLLIVGPDDGFLLKLKKITKRLDLEDKIIFTGPLFGNDKYAAYTKADIFVSPARYEPFGITFLEAMAFGLPVVTINNVGLADAIKNKCGLVVNYNQKELCGAILKILSDGNMRKRMGDKGKRIVKQFDYKRIARQMERVYLDVIKMHSKNKV